MYAAALNNYDKWSTQLPLRFINCNLVYIFFTEKLTFYFLSISDIFIMF